jgi:hypothetical protein
MFTGFAVVRGAELAEVEAGAFGIDHPTVGAIWVETIGFPQPVADTIRKAACAPAATGHAARSGPAQTPARWPPPSRSAAPRRPRSPRCRRACNVCNTAAMASPTPRSASSTRRFRTPSRRSERRGAA